MLQKVSAKFPVRIEPEILCSNREFSVSKTGNRRAQQGNAIRSVRAPIGDSRRIRAWPFEKQENPANLFPQVLNQPSWLQVPPRAASVSRGLGQYAPPLGVIYPLLPAIWGNAGFRVSDGSSERPLPSFPAATRSAPGATTDRQPTAFATASRNRSVSPSRSRRLREGKRRSPHQFRTRNNRNETQQTRSKSSNLEENQRQQLLSRRS